ncbi:hypothetical protein [[Micrococcus luteus] ATCC 49442]|jgi:hypothetical protein|uniref:hypothetical protein n=1 Tax=[Micrococcus luteus] ATCC 49442 TaxID=2698727 RepID=UPI0013D93BEE|nr:hypothetical protein [[Micrococcus luteus] ATCC 49442]
MNDADVRIETVAKRDVEESSSLGAPATVLPLGEMWAGDVVLMASQQVRFRKEDWP